jgi:hypothetical protein
LPKSEPTLRKSLDNLIYLVNMFAYICALGGTQVFYLWATFPTLGPCNMKYEFIPLEYHKFANIFSTSAIPMFIFNKYYHRYRSYDNLSNIIVQSEADQFSRKNMLYRRLIVKGIHAPRCS